MEVDQSWIARVFCISCCSSKNTLDHTRLPAQQTVRPSHRHIDQNEAKWSTLSLKSGKWKQLRQLKWNLDNQNYVKNIIFCNSLTCSCICMCKTSPAAKSFILYMLTMHMKFFLILARHWNRSASNATKFWCS